MNLEIFINEISNHPVLILFVFFLLAIVLKAISNDRGELVFLMLFTPTFIFAILGIFFLIENQKFWANSIVTKAKILDLVADYNYYYGMYYNII